MLPFYYLAIMSAVIFLVVACIFFHARYLHSMWDDSVSANCAMTSVLGLSDLAISTEARYSRHLALSDIFSAFQDTPSGLDILPSGTFFTPPAHVGLPAGCIKEYK